MKLPFLSLIACVSSTQIACDEKNKCHPKADCYQEKNKQESVQIRFEFSNDKNSLWANEQLVVLRAN